MTAATTGDPRPGDPDWEYPTGEGRRSPAGELIALVCPDGRSIQVTEEPDYDLGRVYYRVEKVGTFTLSMDDHHEVYDVTKTDEHRSSRGYRASAERGYVMEVHYGRKDHVGRQGGYDPLPDAPTLYGVELFASCVYTASDATRHNGWWAPVVRRATGATTAEDVPPGTRKRTAMIVCALTTHWMARPDRARLDAVARARRAPARIASARREIARIEAEIAKRRAQIDDWNAYLARQEDALNAPS